MAKVMKSEDIEAEFGLSASQIEEWAKDAENGIYHGEPCEIITVKMIDKASETTDCSRNSTD